MSELVPPAPWPSGWEYLASTELGLIRTTEQQRDMIDQMMAPELKPFLGELPPLRVLILFEWSNVKLREPLATYFHIPGEPNTTVYMAVIKHTNGQRWVSFNTTAQKANESVARKAIYHLELYDRFHGAGFTKGLITPLDELSPYGFRGLMRDIEVMRCVIINECFNCAPYNQVPEVNRDAWQEWKDKNPPAIEDMPVLSKIEPPKKSVWERLYKIERQLGNKTPTGYMDRVFMGTHSDALNREVRRAHWAAETKIKNRKIDGKPVVIMDTIARFMNNHRNNNEWRLHDWFITAKLNTPLPIDESLDESIYETQILSSVEEAIAEQTTKIAPPALDALDVINSDDETFEIKIEDTSDDELNFNINSHITAQKSPPPLPIMPVLSDTMDSIEEPLEQSIEIGVPSVIVSPLNSPDNVDTDPVEDVLSIAAEQAPPPIPPLPENEIIQCGNNVESSTSLDSDETDYYAIVKQRFSTRNGCIVTFGAYRDPVDNWHACMAELGETKATGKDAKSGDAARNAACRKLLALRDAAIREEEEKVAHESKVSMESSPTPQNEVIPYYETHVCTLHDLYVGEYEHADFRRFFIALVKEIDQIQRLKDEFTKQRATCSVVKNHKGKFDRETDEFKAYMESYSAENVRSLTGIGVE